MGRPLKQNKTCEFWTGRAGSGKTQHCIDQVALTLKESPQGTPLWLIVPEQASLQIERRLLDRLESIGGGYTRARILSFRLLAQESLSHNGGRPDFPLADSGRIMALHRVLKQLKPELKTLGSIHDTSELASTVSSLLSGFQDNGWKIDRLESMVSSLPDQPDPDLPVDPHELGKKLNDLLLVWKKYEAYLENAGCCDPYQVTQAAIKSMHKWESIRGVKIWIDGFASFTSQEWEMIEALMDHAAWMAITLCMDPERLVFPPGTLPCFRQDTPVGPEKLFRNIEYTLESCMKKIDEQGWNVQVREFPAPHVKHTRFDASPPLDFMEHRVLGRMQPHIFLENADAPVHETGRLHNLQHSMECLEAADHTAEIEAIARRIVNLCRTSDLSPDPADPAANHISWRDVAVITRDLDSYADTIRIVFHHFNIPFFIDSPRRMQSHPLTRLLLSALNVIRSGWSGESVIQYLRCGMSGVEELSLIDRIENLVLTTDQGSRAWLEKIRKEKDLRNAWGKSAILLQQLEKSLLEETSMARTFWSFIKSSRAAECMDRWIESCRSLGEEEAVLLHEQAWEQTIRWLEQLDMIEAATVDNDKDTNEQSTFESKVGEMMDLIGTGLGTTQARLIPPTLNQVTVGSVERSRTPEVKIVFVIGLNEGEFPRLVAPEPFLNDDERTMIHQKFGQEARSRHLHEHYLAYIALTRSSRALVVSRPLIDSRGRVANPSPYLSTLVRSFPEMPCRTINRSAFGDDEQLPLRPEEWNMRLSQAIDASADPAGIHRLLVLMRQGDPLRHPFLSASASSALLYARRIQDDKESSAELPAGLMKRFWKSKPYLAVTALEQYGQCPFRFFLRDMLKVHPREEAVIDARDLGIIRHRALEMIFLDLAKEGMLDWKTVDYNTACGIIDRVIDQFREIDMAESLKYSPLVRLQIDQVRDELRIFIQALILVASRSDTIQVDAEYLISFRVNLPDSAPIPRLELKGKIDRIDRHATAAPGTNSNYILYDYKSGARDIRPGLLIGGVDIQLALYSIALVESQEEDNIPSKVGGFFYWPVTLPLKDGDENINPSSPLLDEQWFSKRRPTGLFTEPAANFLDTQVSPGEAALAYYFRRTNNGELNKQTQSHLPENAMELLLSKTRGGIIQNAQSAAEGKIPLKPCMTDRNTTACDWCDYADTCRIREFDHRVFRQIPSVKRNELVEECRLAEGK
jgi:ATP-dependent helicase/nuclease subunit B